MAFQSTFITARCHLAIAVIASLYSASAAPSGNDELANSVSVSEIISEIYIVSGTDELTGDPDSNCGFIYEAVVGGHVLAGAREGEIVSFSSTRPLAMSGMYFVFLTRYSDENARLAPGGSVNGQARLCPQLAGRLTVTNLPAYQGAETGSELLFEVWRLSDEAKLQGDRAFDFLVASKLLAMRVIDSANAQDFELGQIEFELPCQRRNYKSIAFPRDDLLSFIEVLKQ